MLHLHGSDPLSEIINQIARLQHLSQTLRGALPAPLEQHCQVANVRGQSLLLHADTAAWATRLRYMAPTLVTALQNQGYPGIQHITVKVRPRYNAPEPAVTPRKRNMSQSSARILRDTADSLSDPAIKRALKRLASRGPKD